MLESVSLLNLIFHFFEKVLVFNFKQLKYGTSLTTIWFEISNYNYV